MADTCRSCQASIIWLDNAMTGKPAPIDAEPAPNGNIRIGAAGKHYLVLTGDQRQDAIDRSDPLHFNHFATCPQSAAWRERTARAGGS